MAIEPTPSNSLVLLIVHAPRSVPYGIIFFGSHPSMTSKARGLEDAEVRERMMFGTLPSCSVIISHICFAGTPTREFTMASARSATWFEMVPPLMEESDSVVFPLFDDQLHDSHFTSRS